MATAPETPQDKNWKRSQVVPVVSVDLVASAQSHLALLHAVDSWQCLYSGPAVGRAIRRYEQCWLPLFAEYVNFSEQWAGTVLLPPLDVRWVWHCHLLSPSDYESDCTTMFGKVINLIDVDLSDKALVHASKAATQQVWDVLYPDDAYVLDLAQYLPRPLARKISDADQANTVDDIYCQQWIKYDLAAAMERERNFAFQVSSPHYRTPAFLHASFQRYKAFIYLQREEGATAPCVPTVDIDLMIRTHKIQTSAYLSDTAANARRGPDEEGSGDPQLMNPVPWGESRDEVYQSFLKTADHWESFYGLSYDSAGTLFRTRPPFVPPSVSKSRLRGIQELAALPAEPRDVNGQYGLSRRLVFECKVGAVGRMSATAQKVDLQLKVVANARASAFLLKAPMSGMQSVRPEGENHSWLLNCEAASLGVSMSAKNKVTGMGRALMKKKEPMGAISFLWRDLVASPTLQDCKKMPLSASGKPNQGAAEEGVVGVSLSITPPLQGPYLLMAVVGPYTDDKGDVLGTSKAYSGPKDGGEQTGRWATRAILDHTGAEKFVALTRVASGPVSDLQEVASWNKIIEIRRGGWAYCNGQPRGVQGSVVDRLTQAQTSNMELRRVWKSRSGWSVNISREEGKAWPQGFLSLAMWATMTADVADDEEDAMEGVATAEAQLLCGRHGHYYAGANKARTDQEDGFVTLMRHSRDAPLGKATALFNWRMGAVEVTPEEDVVLVLLLCAAIGQSVYDMTEKGRVPKLFIPNSVQRVEDDEWGSVVVLKKLSSTNSTPDAEPLLPPWHYCDPALWRDKGIYAKHQLPPSSYEDFPSYLPGCRLPSPSEGSSHSGHLYSSYPSSKSSSFSSSPSMASPSNFGSRTPRRTPPGHSFLSLSNADEEFGSAREAPKTPGTPPSPSNYYPGLTSRSPLRSLSPLSPAPLRSLSTISPAPLPPQVLGSRKVVVRSQSLDGLSR